MEFTGRIAKVLQERSGISQRTGNAWRSMSFIFEYFEADNERFADRVVLETMNESYFPLIKEGKEVTIAFGHKASEYEGRWYNHLNIYRFKAADSENKPVDDTNDNGVGSNTTENKTTAENAQNNTKDNENDGLPF